MPNKIRSKARIKQDLKSVIPLDNLRRLSKNLIESFDSRIAEFLYGTPFEKVRQSDMLVVVNVARGEESFSDLARALGVSRQAVHMSAKRLQKLGVVDFEPVPNNKRDKRLVITRIGAIQLKRGAKELAKVERELADVVGPSNFKRLKKHLAEMNAALVARRQARSKRR